jgi:hypothetical protein
MTMEFANLWVKAGLERFLAVSSQPKHSEYLINIWMGRKLEEIVSLAEGKN